MPNPKKTVLLLGQNGLMTDVLQSVLCKEDWQLLRSKWTNEQWQSCVRLHNPQTIIAFVMSWLCSISSSWSQKKRRFSISIS